MRKNLKMTIPQEFTFNGAPAARLNAEQALRRSIMSCFLWEKEFYEDGEEIASRIEKLAAEVKPQVLASLAVEARTHGHLRHVPLLLASVLAKTGAGQEKLVSNTIANVVQRADELNEFVAIHATRNGINLADPKANIRKILSAQIKKGLAQAFLKFDDYQLAKYDRDTAVRLRDVAFLCHPKAGSDGAVGRRLASLTNKTHYPSKTKSGFQVKRRYKLKDYEALETPDTWETELSAGKDKKKVFTRLLKQEKLGYLALLRNLRNMAQAGVDDDLIKRAIVARKGAHRVLPFRYVAAARACPQYEPALDEALCEAVGEMPSLPGKTIVLVDVSRSMTWKLSEKSDLNRIDAAATLASIINGNLRLFSFSDRLVEVPPRRGMAGVDVIRKSQPNNGTALFDAVAEANQYSYDRMIVITDEQANPARYAAGYIQGKLMRLPDPKGRGFMVNVASTKNGVGYGTWVHIDGFSDHILRFIHEYESGTTGRV